MLYLQLDFTTSNQSNYLPVGFFSTIRNALRREGGGAAASPASSVRRGSHGGGLDVVAGCGDSMAVAAVYRCVKVLSDSVAGLPLRHLRKEGGRFVVDEGSALQYLLSVEPEPSRSAYTMWSMAVQQMLLDGNAYIYPRRVDGEITDLVLCEPWSVTHDINNDTYTVADWVNGVFGRFREGEMIHLFIHSHDGKRGVSVLQHARRTIGIATAGDVETSRRFSNGGNVKGLITNDRSVTGFGEYQDTELENVAVDIDAKLSQGRFASLPGQVDLKTISLSSADMQFLESRKFTVKEICRFFGVNPQYVFEDTTTNYKSAENANMDFLTNTLDPILKRVEGELVRKLIGRTGIGRERISYDRRGIYSLDLQSRVDYQKKTIEAGIYSINDWRRMENQPDVEGGDTIYVSTNLAPIGSGKLYGENT